MYPRRKLHGEIVKLVDFTGGKLVDFTGGCVLDPVGLNVVVGPSTGCSGRSGVKVNNNIGLDPSKLYQPPASFAASGTNVLFTFETT